MRRPATSNLRSFVASLAFATAAGALFWLPSYRAARGFFPAPLDDVYIHFDFARSLALGHPFEWIPGNGYSSGETSPLYAVVLAAGFCLGFRGRLMGVWAAIVAVFAVASFLRSLRTLVRPCAPWLSWCIALLPLSVGIVDWSLFSGMEVATFAAALGQSLLALEATRSHIDERRGRTREAAQTTLGVWGAVLVLLRPESGVLVAIFTVVAARGAQRRSGVAAILRAAVPGVAVTALVLATNRVFSGQAQSAGAQLKLLSSNPYLSDVDRARVYAENLVLFALKGVRTELFATSPSSIVIPALAVTALLSPKRRSLAGACLLGATGWVLLVASNSNAPYHNFRYYAPALLLVFVAVGLGVATIARAIARPYGPWLAGAIGLTTSGLCATRIPVQMKHFQRAVANIRDQQIEIAMRLATTTAPGSRVLLGDAGAIPFVSGRPALDALGLGGYRRMPFARAAVHGEAATVELIERLTAEERPTYLALYPNWFGLITSTFGVELSRVTLTDNLICGGATKVIYRADWSALEASPFSTRTNLIDELDIADIVSEEEHGYVSPVPRGGWTTLEVLADASGARRFDGGRIIPEGASETFVVRNSGNAKRVRVIVRVDANARGLRIRSTAGTTAFEMVTPQGGTWREVMATINAPALGDVLTLEATSGPYRNYHVWLTR